MRALLLLVARSVALGWTAVPAQANVQSYCEAYARHEADARLSGGAILGGESEITAAERALREAHALADCLALYTPQTRIEPVTAEAELAPGEPLTAVQAKQKVEPELAPVESITAVQTKQKAIAAPKLKRKTVTVTARALKKKPAAELKPAPAEDDPWKTFDNPNLPER